MRLKLIEKRKNKKKTQQEMSKLLGISRSNYNAYELGNINIPLDKALKIKQILNYKNDDIFFETECPKNKQE